MLQFLFSLLLCLPALAIIEAPVNPIDFEQNPFHLEWKKIDTDHFEIIFPKEVTAEAQRVAHLLEAAYPFVTRSLEVAPPKISLVLQNQSVVSNGFVTLAPRRSEWYVTPAIDPDLGSTEWLKTLSVHEFRHVVQFQKTRQRFNRVFEFFMGQIGQALGLALTLPPWFLEGDAVGMETALTKGGRGRLPLFERDLRTLLLSGKDFDFDKAHLRSYKDWVPNHYVYGYFLTSGIRNKYGDLFLSKLADQSAVTSWNPLSFYRSADKLLEGNFEQFYAETMGEMLAAWRSQLDKLNPTPFEVKSVPKPHGWTNYSYPQVTSSGKILALKNGLSFINHFVLMDGGKEETLFYPGGLVAEYPYKLRQDKFAYLEQEVDPRWGYRDFTRLKVYDLKESRHVLDVPRTKWRLAVLGHAANKVMAVEWGADQAQAVVVTDLQGRELKRVPLPKEEVVTSIDWKNEDEAVIVVKDHDDMKALKLLSLRDGKVSPLTPKGTDNLGFVTVNEGQVLVESPASGIDNIYLLKDGALKQLTSSRFGAYAPTLGGGKLTYSDYTVEGLEVVTKSSPWEKEEASSGSFVPVYEKFAKFEGRESFAAKLAETSTHEVKDYSQLRNAVNLHSWLVFAPPLSNTVTLVGYSRDVLNKFSLSTGGEYNVDDKTGLAFVSAAWSHLYPVFDIRAAYGNRRQNIKVSNTRSEENKWEEGTLEVGAQLPWKKITGRFNEAFTARAFAKFIHATGKISTNRTQVNDGTLFSPGIQASYSFLSRMALRDILPPWGASLRGHFEEGRDVTGVDQKGSLLSLDSMYFLPGVGRHHSFYQELAYERQRDDSYQYASFIFYPRGTKKVFLQEFVKYSANYTLPLFYPDRHWSRYVYAKRIAANLFYDAVDGRYRSFSYHAGSAGWEVLLETNLLRLLLPLTWGVRGSYVVDGIEKGARDNYEVFIVSTLGVF